MDLLALDTSVKSSKGAMMVIRHPVSGEILTAENGKKQEEMFLNVLGRDSKEFTAALHESIKLLEDDKVDDMIAKSAPYVVGGRVFLGGEWIDVGSENIYSILEKCRWMIPSIMEFAVNLENFFPDTEKT